MHLSLFDMFTIGIGPSSSHTVGPMRAARRFVESLDREGLIGRVAHVKAELFGSLGHTGKGHGSDVAVMLGLEGERPEALDPDTVPARIEAIRATKEVKLLGFEPVRFDPGSELVERGGQSLVFHRRQSLPAHPNGMRFTADLSDGEPFVRIYYSLGRRVRRERRPGRAHARRAKAAALPVHERAGSAHDHGGPRPLDQHRGAREREGAEARGRGARKLAFCQRGDGRFSYWPGGTHTDDWSSIYAGHFLLEAARLGHAVPGSMRTGWTASQRNAARAWSPATEGRSAFVQAYRLFALALAGAAKPAAMNRLRSIPTLEPMARWTLAAAYAELGRTDAANALTTGISAGITDYAELSGTFGSAVRHEALIALTLLRSGRLPEAGPVVLRIAERLGSDQWLSTQSAAFALMAVARYTAANGQANGLDLTVAIDGKPTTVRSARSTWHMALGTPARPHTVHLVNKGTGLVFTRITRHGTPGHGEENASSNGLSNRTTFTGTNGSTLDPAVLTQGTDVLVNVEVTHVGTEPLYSNLALSQVSPPNGRSGTLAWKVWSRTIPTAPTPTRMCATTG